MPKYVFANDSRHNAIQAQPPPSHPSYGLLMTLRVLHLPDNSDKLSAIEQGRLSFISRTNEEAVSDSLRYICERVIRASRGGHRELEEASNDDDDDVRQSAVEMVRTLWKEEGRIARECLKHLDIC